MREKPEHERERFAFLAAGGVAAVIGIFWLIGFSSSMFLAFREFGSGEGGENLAAISTSVSGIGTNLAGVGRAFQDLSSENDAERNSGEARVEVVDKGGVEGGDVAEPRSITF
jgi:hypothetical protein